MSKRRSPSVHTLALFAACCAAAAAQTPAPSPSPTSLPYPSPAAGAASPAPNGASPAPNAATPTPTPPPITVQPSSAMVSIGSPLQLHVGSALSPISAVSQNTAVADVSVDQPSETVTVTGKTPGITSVTIRDARGLTSVVAIRVAFFAGSVPSEITLQLTGDPASQDFVRQQVARAIADAAQLRPGAQIIVSPDDVPFHGSLDQDNSTSVNVSVVMQGTSYVEVDTTIRVDIANVAVPRISPGSLMVSDYPERLTENGLLFAADLPYAQPSRFLYFHYNPPGQPDRRIVLRAENSSGEPAIVQFISGRGGPTANEMEVGHRATKDFLVNVVQNQGRLLTIPGRTAINIAQQDLPPGTIVANLLQLRVLSGGNVHLTLFAQNADDSPDVALTSTTLLQGVAQHARGIYPIPEFHFATQWSVNDDYLELPIGHLPLPNAMQGQVLSGDYGVLQSFVVNVQNPMSTPQTIAIYENPRGGHATGTYLIDGVLVQSHQVPPFSRYKVRQYTIPARGFVRVTIVTMPEAGSSLPLRLVFAPDDGSVAPGASGSPIY